MRVMLHFCPFKEGWFETPRSWWYCMVHGALRHDHDPPLVTEHCLQTIPSYDPHTKPYPPPPTPIRIQSPSGLCVTPGPPSPRLEYLLCNKCHLTVMSQFIYLFLKPPSFFLQACNLNCVDFEITFTFNCHCLHCHHHRFTLLYCIVLSVLHLFIIIIAIAELQNVTDPADISV